MNNLVKNELLRYMIMHLWVVVRDAVGKVEYGYLNWKDTIEFELIARSANKDVLKILLHVPFGFYRLLTLNNEQYAIPFYPALHRKPFQHFTLWTKLLNRLKAASNAISRI